MLSLSVCSGHLPLHTPTLTTGKRLEQKIMGSNTRKCVGTNLYSEMLYIVCDFIKNWRKIKEKCIYFKN
jgi:hypothetical protein